MSKTYRHDNELPKIKFNKKQVRKKNLIKGSRDIRNIKSFLDDLEADDEILDS